MVAVGAGVAVASADGWIVVAVGAGVAVASADGWIVVAVGNGVAVRAKGIGVVPSPQAARAASAINTAPLNSVFFIKPTSDVWSRRSPDGPHLYAGISLFDLLWWTALSAGISHIKLPGPKHLTIFDESHSSLTHECRQPSHQAHKTIRRRRELVFDGSEGGFHYVCTPSNPSRHAPPPWLPSSPPMTPGMLVTLKKRLEE